MPVRWRKMPLTENSLRAKGDVVPSLMFYAHGRGCSGSDPWAANIDSAYGAISLCGHVSDRRLAVNGTNAAFD
jgi:hypothetical protein